MGFLNKLFGGNKVENISELSFQRAKFGRYTDSQKTDQQRLKWDDSVRFYKEGKYFDAFDSFLQYICDPIQNNVRWEKNSDSSIHFFISQGSKEIEGEMNSESIHAKIRLAEIESPNVGFMRKLLNLNFAMQYSRFAIDLNTICQKFSSSTRMSSPMKLYAAFREMALNGDKQDDLLLSEFSGLKPIENNIVKQLEEKEKRVKYLYFKKWIDEAVNMVEKNSDQRIIPGNSWVLLNLVYKIDYLISPEGKLTNALEKIQFDYFSNTKASDFEKNQLMLSEIKKLGNISEEAFFQSMYSVKMTFGVVNPSTHKQVYEFIVERIKDTKWYYDNRYYDYEQAIYEYTIGYCFFNYGMFELTSELLHLAFIILNPDYFIELGFPHQFVDQKSKQLNKEAIEKQINTTVKKWQTTFPKLDFKINRMRYQTIQDFICVFIDEITYLNYQK